MLAMPHLGASTPESEQNCAVMAVDQLRDYLENGNIRNSVNLPAVSQERSGVCRLCLIHKNVPAMLASITTLLSRDGINVENLSNKSPGGLRLHHRGPERLGGPVRHRRGDGAGECDPGTGHPVSAEGLPPARQPFPIDSRAENRYNGFCLFDMPL